MIVQKPPIDLKRTARIAGFWYLLLAISGVIGFLVLHGDIYETKDAIKTLSNLNNSLGLARVRLFCEFVIIISQSLTAVYLYKLFKGFNKISAWSIGIWGSTNAVIIMLSAISMASSIEVASSSIDQESKLVLIEFFNQIIRHSWSMGGIFFGLWLIPLGHVSISSKRIPIWIGRILILGGLGYILSIILYYFGFRSTYIDVLTVPATIGEFWMIGYLLIYGIRDVE